MIYHKRRYFEEYVTVRHRFNKYLKECYIPKKDFVAALDRAMKHPKQRFKEGA